MTAETPTKVKVRCSDRDGCGWSGERPDGPEATARRCPLCRCYTIERVGRTRPAGR